MDYTLYNQTHVCHSVGQSVSQSFHWSLSHLVGHSPSQSVGHLVVQLISQSLVWLVIRSLFYIREQFVSQSVYTKSE